MFEQYISLGKTLRRYYRGYGGLRTFLTSPLTHVAMLFTLIACTGGADMDWRAVSAATLPAILGFSLAAYVLIFTLMGGELHTALSQIIESRRSVNYLSLINSTFFHAIFVQVITYLFSVFSKGDLVTSLAEGYNVFGLDGWAAEEFWVGLTDAVGIFLTTYSLLLVVGVLIAVFRLASATDASTPTDALPSSPNSSDPPSIP